jgi:hypothetical protein
MSESEAERHFVQVREAFEGEPGVGTGRMFTAEGLKVDGKFFAILVRGTFVLKLPRERVAAIVAEGAGHPFEPGPGRLMKEWVVVDSDPAGWLDLAKAACTFVRTVQKK